MCRKSLFSLLALKENLLFLTESSALHADWLRFMFCHTFIKYFDKYYMENNWLSQFVMFLKMYMPLLFSNISNKFKDANLYNYYSL